MSDYPVIPADLLELWNNFKLDRKASLAQHNSAFQKFLQLSCTPSFQTLSHLVWIDFGRHLKEIPMTDDNSIPVARSSTVAREYIGQWEWFLDRYAEKFN